MTWSAMVSCYNYSNHKMKFSIKEFFSKCDQIRPITVTTGGFEQQISCIPSSSYLTHQPT